MKKKIAFISEHASPLATLGGVDSGGQNVYVAQLARHLTMMGYSVDVFTRKENEAVEDVVHWLPDVRVIHIKAGPSTIVPKENLLPLMDEFAVNMIRFIKREKIYYELVHANFFMSALVASMIKEVLSIPYVVTFHALGLVRKMHQKEMDQFPAERIEIERKIIREADKIIAECPQDKMDMIQLYEGCAEKISIISCGFSPEEFYPVKKERARNILHFPTYEKIILQLGRMVPRKGVDNVIRALGELKNKNQKAKLVIVGGEGDLAQCPEIRRLKNIAHDNGVESSVIFMGKKQREVLKYYYSAADIFVSTPWYEPFGITPLESMACGTAVVGSEVGGIKYTVKDGKTGFLVPPKDPKALAAKIDILLNDEKTLSAMKTNSIKRVNKYFTWKGVAKKCHELYEEVIHAGNKKLKTRIWQLPELRLYQDVVSLPEPSYVTNAIFSVNE